jgi:diguanylate cyclase (GGDEF)-like protein
MPGCSGDLRRELEAPLCVMKPETSAPYPRYVLAIDDSEVCRRLVGRQLQGENIEVIEARDGPTGLSAVREHPPDLILLDISLPGWDGFETIRRLKDDPRTRSIPVIFLSASSSSHEKARGLDLGAVDFVAKPFDPVELMADWALCGRLGRPLAVIVADLDRFKTVNDLHGHWAGDEVLRGAAHVLRDAVRGGDFVGRMGGEEFVVIAPDCDLDGALNLAERFREEISALEFKFNGASISITASLGTAASHDTSQGDPTEVLCRADWAMYQAKTEGRNTVRAWGRAVPESLIA